MPVCYLVSVYTYYFIYGQERKRVMTRKKTTLTISIENLDASISKKIAQVLTELETKPREEHKQIVKRYFWYLKNDLLEKNDTL